MRRIVRIERRVDLDHLRRADRRAHVAGDALRRAVGPLRQHVLAAVVGGVVPARLLRVVRGERALAAGDPAAHVAQENTAGDEQAAHDLGQVRPLPRVHRHRVPVLLADVRAFGHAVSSHTATTVTTRLATASGNMNFHANASTWSQRKRGSVQRIRIWKLDITSTFPRNVTSWTTTTTPCGSATFQPPGNAKPWSLMYEIG